MEGMGAASGRRAVAAVALALVALLLAASPLLERVDLALLDAQWSVVRRVAARPAADDIIVVGIDAASVRAIREPPGLWHEALGKALARIAAAQPRAIGLDLALPERSFEQVRPGLDRALLLGLAAARQNGPFVATLEIDARTRSARTIHAPYFVVLQEERLGLGLIARDADGTTRRFALTLPTEDGAFPTFVGRLCRAMGRRCGEGLLHFALGRPFPTIPLRQVLEATDLKALEAVFRDRIVLVGITQPDIARIAVPVNYAAWEAPSRDTPEVVVHALALRTALLDAGPQEASRPLSLLLASVPALLLLIRRRALAAAALAAFAAGAFALSVAALGAGLAIPIAAPLVVAFLALAVLGAEAAAGRYVIRRR